MHRCGPARLVALLVALLCVGGASLQADEAPPKSPEALHPQLILQHDINRDGMVTLFEFVASLNRRFALLDVDRDQKLSFSEFAVQERHLGHDSVATFPQMDGNRDGWIIVDEFFAGSQNTFWAFDANRDRLVTPDEVHAASLAQGSKPETSGLVRKRRDRSRPTGAQANKTNRSLLPPIVIAIADDTARGIYASHFVREGYRVRTVDDADQLRSALTDPSVRIVFLGMHADKDLRDHLCRLLMQRNDLFINLPRSNFVGEHFTSLRNLRLYAARVQDQLESERRGGRSGACDGLQSAYDRPF